MSRYSRTTRLFKRKIQTSCTAYDWIPRRLLKLKTKHSKRSIVSAWRKPSIRSWRIRLCTSVDSSLWEFKSRRKSGDCICALEIVAALSECKQLNCGCSSSASALKQSNALTWRQCLIHVDVTDAQQVRRQIRITSNSEKLKSRRAFLGENQHCSWLLPQHESSQSDEPRHLSG